VQINNSNYASFVSQNNTAKHVIQVMSKFGFIDLLKYLSLP